MRRKYARIGEIMRNQWKGFFYGVAFTLLVLIGGVTICRIFQFHPFDHSVGTMIADKVNVLDKYIENHYWKEVDKKDLETGALKGMIAALDDRYSGYFTEEEYQSIMAGITGSYTGIGATVTQNKSGEIVIYAVTEGSAAEKAGIMEKDIIKSVDGADVSGKSLDEVISVVKGKEGTKVTLGILRGGKAMDIEVVRAQIKNISIRYKMLGTDIGYIKISDFDDESPKQFRKAIDELDKKGQKGMIIDLRNNGGGSLTAVVDMLDRMLPAKTVLTVKEKNTEDEVYKSTDKEQFDKPCVVLINGDSASASEVFAGALQDHKAAALVGTKSFGKGIVQSIYSLKDFRDGGALKLTTARYYLPSGRCIHEVGLTPDVEVEYTGDKDNYEESKDNQLQKAVDTLREINK